MTCKTCGGLCWSRGPRIGNSGTPVCKKPRDHDGLHAAGPGDGWSQGVVWGDPPMRVVCSDCTEREGTP